MKGKQSLMIDTTKAKHAATSSTGSCRKLKATSFPWPSFPHVIKALKNNCCGGYGVFFYSERLWENYLKRSV